MFLSVTWRRDKIIVAWCNSLRVESISSKHVANIQTESFKISVFLIRFIIFLFKQNCFINFDQDYIFYTHFSSLPHWKGELFLKGEHNYLGCVIFHITLKDKQTKCFKEALWRLDRARQEFIVILLKLYFVYKLYKLKFKKLF